jgi:predicted  nucleic acid-binding Zn-ribbon protein
MTTAINEQIKILVELQKIDGQIYRLKKELAAHPERQKRIDAEFEKKKTQAKAADEALKALQVRQKQKEGDLASREDKIAKLQAQLYQLKSNKEYSTMELEIKGLKADKSVLEEDVLRLLDEVDQAKTVLAKEKEILSEEEKKSREAGEILKKQAAEIEKNMRELDERRKVFVPNVEARLLSQYERILKGLEGLALVPVVHNSCGGCHMELPPQVVHEAQLSDKWIVCESCARILYWPP